MKRMRKKGRKKKKKKKKRTIRRIRIRSLFPLPLLKRQKLVSKGNRGKFVLLILSFRSSTISSHSSLLSKTKLCHTCIYYWSAYLDGGPSWCQAWQSRIADRVCRWTRDCILIPLPAKFYVLLAQPSVCLSNNISFTFLSTSWGTNYVFLFWWTSCYYNFYFAKVCDVWIFAYLDCVPWYLLSFIASYFPFLAISIFLAMWFDCPIPFWLMSNGARSTTQT